MVLLVRKAQAGAIAERTKLSKSAVEGGTWTRGSVQSAAKLNPSKLRNNVRLVKKHMILDGGGPRLRRNQRSDKRHEQNREDCFSIRILESHDSGHW